MGRRRALALVLVPAALVAGCGKSSPREQADDYVGQANAVQSQAAPAFRAANRAYARFVAGRLSGEAAIRELAAAERAIRRTSRRLAALDPPKVARRLSADLQAVYRLDAGLAHETVLLARYGPARQGVLLAVQRANRRLGLALGKARTPSRQAAALGAYARTLRGEVAVLRRLHPPPVAAGAQRFQLARLRASRRLAGELRGAVVARDGARTARLIVLFRATGRIGRAERVLQARQVAAYQARRLAVGRAIARAQRERARLDRG